MNMYGLPAEMPGLSRIRTTTAPFLTNAGNISYIAIAMALSYTFSLTIVVASIMAGRLPGDKSDNLAAAGLIMSMLGTFVSIAEAPVFAMNIIINNELGKTKQIFDLIANRGEGALATPEETAQINQLREKISATLKNGILIGIPPLILPLFALYYSKFVLSDIFGQRADISEEAKKFLRIYSFALPALSLIRMTTEQILFSFEKQIQLMVLALISFAIGSGMAYWFCFGGAGINPIGMQGIAYGYLIETYLTAILFASLLHFDKSFKGYHFFAQLFTKIRATDIAILKELSRIGIPIFAATASQVIAPFVNETLTGRLDRIRNTSPRFLAVQTYSSSLNSALVLLELALGQAVAQQTNRQLGQAQMLYKASNNNSEQVFKTPSQTARHGMLTMGLLVGTLCLIVAACPQVITNIVSNTDPSDTQVIPLAQQNLRVIAAAILAETILNGMVQTMRSLKSNKLPMFVSIASLWIGVGVSYALAFPGQMNVLGLAIGYLVGNALGCAALVGPYINRTSPSGMARLTDAPEGNSLRQICADPRSFFLYHRINARVTGTNEENRLLLSLNNSVDPTTPPPVSP